MAGFSPPFWLRKTLILPEHVAGVPLVGGAAQLSVNCLGEVQVFVDGRAVRNLGPGAWVIPLTDRAYPGRKIVVAVYVRRMAGPVVFRSVDLILTDLSGLRTIASDLLLDLENAALLLRLTSAAEEARWRREFLRAVDQVDLEGLYARDERAFAASAARAKQALAVLGGLAKEMNVFLAGRATLDPFGRCAKAQLIDTARSTTREVLRLLDRFPELVVCRSEAMLHAWLEELDPSLHSALVKRANEHRYVLMGGAWSDFDPELAGGESIIRQYLLGKRYFAEVYGQEVEIATFPGAPSAGSNLPEFLAGCGMRGVIFDSPPPDVRGPFPWNLFLWEAPSGARILAYCLPGRTASSPEQEILLDLERVYSRHRLRDVGVLFEVADDQGPPAEEIIQRLVQAASRPLFPSPTFADPASFIDRMVNNPHGVEYPLYSGRVDLARYPERFAAVPEIRRLVRHAECLLEDLEKVCCVLSQRTGAAFPVSTLDESWQTLLLYQRRPVMSGVADAAVLAEARQGLKSLCEQLQSQCDRALRKLAREVDTQAMPQAVLVFNPLCWVRDGAVAVPSPFRGAAVSVKNHWGETVPSQMVGNGDRPEICFLAENVPPFGFKVFHLVSEETSDAPPTMLQVNGTSVTTDSLRFSIDPETGQMDSLRLTGTDTDLLGGGGLWLEPSPPENQPEATRRGSNVRVVVTEKGPVRATIRVEKQWDSSVVVHDIQAIARQPRVDIHTEVRSQDEGKDLRFRMVTALFAPTAVAETAGGVQEMKTVTGLKINGPIAGYSWASLTCPNESVGLALLNDARPGVLYGSHELTLALRSTKEPLDFTTSVYPYRGDWRSAQPYRQAEELGHPLLVAQIDMHPGRLPAMHSVAQVLPDHVLLGSTKPIGRTPGLILRLWEVNGSRCRAEVSVGSPVLSAEELTLLEGEPIPLEYADRTVFVPIGSFQVKTVRICY
jgi:alpha-mannosidase